MTGKLPFITGILAMLACQAPLHAEGDAREWLERMSSATQSLNYSGTFVYQHEGRLEAMQVLHAMDEDGERQRMMSLTGPRREVLRDNREVTCILGDSQSVVVNKSRPRLPFPASFPSQLDELEKNYRFQLQGEDRVAGLSCQVVEVKPRDNFRYGRRLCVHADSHLLLRSELTDGRNRVIEQVMFTSVEFPSSISEHDLSPDFSAGNYSWQRQPDEQPVSGGQSDSQWQIRQVPDGFMLVDRRWHRLSGDMPVEHWVFSDGLASVSVYIEESGKEHDAYSGQSHRGALNAYGTMVSNHYVTAVGEVPMRTVEMLARSVAGR